MTERDRNDYITKHLPFIIKTVADFTGRYVEVENSEELSIAMGAFNKSIDSHDKKLGNFFTYSKTIIRNSLIDNLRKKDKKNIIELKDNISEKGAFESDVLLKDELKNYEKLLESYNIDFENLCNKSPKHKDTRQAIIEISKKLVNDNEVIKHLKDKKRLPLALIEKDYNISKKRLKSYKIMIIAIIIAYIENITAVIDWIEEKKDRSGLL